MSKLALAALAAAGIFAIYSAPAFAAQAMPRPPGGGTPTPGCTINCGGGGEIDTPGDPFYPGDPGNDPEDDPKDDPTEPGDDPKDDPKDDPTEPGDDPKQPGDDPKDPPGEPGGDPNYPGLTKAQVAELKRCIANLDKLPAVTETQVNQFGQPYKVSLTPVCDTQFKSAVEATSALVEGGNVNGLETAIRRNEAMTGKLGQTQYKPGDVVGIDFDAKGNAILFVHKKRG